MPTGYFFPMVGPLYISSFGPSDKYRMCVSVYIGSASKNINLLGRDGGKSNYDLALRLEDSPSGIVNMCISFAPSSGPEL